MNIGLVLKARASRLVDHDGLTFREAEIEETVRVLHKLNNGQGKDVFATNPRKEGTDLAEWRDRLMMDRMVLGGVAKLFPFNDL